MKITPNDRLGLCVLVIEADEKHTKSSFLLWTYPTSVMKETSSNIERAQISSIAGKPLSLLPSCSLLTKA